MRAEDRAEALKQGVHLALHSINDHTDHLLVRTVLEVTSEGFDI